MLAYGRPTKTDITSAGSQSSTFSGSYLFALIQIQLPRGITSEINSNRFRDKKKRKKKEIVK